MSDKKNIDHLFQEKFQHFEQQPNPELWYQIESRLQRKTRGSSPFGGYRQELPFSL